jgi:copper(I)-binding protein
MRLPALALLGLTVAACQNATAPSVEVSDAVCRPTPNGRDLTGCYMTLIATTDDRLVSVSTDAAGNAEIHEMSTEGGVMTMAEMAGGLPLPAGEATALQPGGNHLMLMQVAAPLAEGDTVELALTFEDAAPITISARVGNPAVN